MAAGVRCVAECIESVLSMDRNLLCRLAAGGEMELMCETLDQMHVWEESQVRRAENNNPVLLCSGPQTNNLRHVLSERLVAVALLCRMLNHL